MEGRGGSAATPDGEDSELYRQLQQRLIEGEGLAGRAQTISGQNGQDGGGSEGHRAGRHVLLVRSLPTRQG